MAARPAPRPDSAPRRGGVRSMQVADRLRETILAGGIPAGQRVNEVQLSRSLGVSRTPTRAALHALAAEGLLDYAANRGFTVRRYSADEIAEAYEIRAVLEGLACRLAAARGPTARLRAELARTLEEGDAVVAAFDGSAAQMEGYRRMNVAFHGAVLAAAGNQMLEDTLRLALARPAATPRNIVAFTEREVRRRHDDHHRIAQAILAGDGWRAELLMREHVTSVKLGQLGTLPQGPAAPVP